MTAIAKSQITSQRLEPFLGGAAAANSYAVYVLHPAILVILALCVRDLALDSLVKFALLAPVALATCFGSAHLIRKLPSVGRIL